MSTREDRGMKAVEVALDHAVSRLSELEGDDRLAFAEEYKEWLADDQRLTERVWFSAEIKQ